MLSAVIILRVSSVSLPAELGGFASFPLWSWSPCDVEDGYDIVDHEYYHDEGSDAHDGDHGDHGGDDDDDDDVADDDNNNDDGYHDEHDSDD